MMRRCLSSATASTLSKATVSVTATIIANSVGMPEPHHESGAMVAFASNTFNHHAHCHHRMPARGVAALPPMKVAESLRTKVYSGLTERNGVDLVGGNTSATIAARFPTLYDWFVDSCKRHQFEKDGKTARVALTCGLSGRSVTYAQLPQRTEQIAQVLYAKYNVRQGSVVAIVSPNTLDYVCVFFAVLRLGGVVTTVNPTYSVEEIATQLQLAKATAIVTITMFESLCAQAANAAELQRMDSKTRKALGLPSDLPPKIPVLSTDHELPTVGAIPKDYDRKQGPDSTIVVPFSSGTTGLPKGVQLTNRSIASNIFQIDGLLQKGDEEVCMSVLPFFHIYGMVALMCASINEGGRQVILPKFDMMDYLKALQREKATILFIVPPIALGFAKHPAVKSFDLRSVKYVISGAAPLGRELQEQVQPLFPNAKFGQGYGLTETGVVVTVVPPGVEAHGCAGALAPGTDIRIIQTSSLPESPMEAVDAEAVQDAAAAEEGEVWVRGPQVMKGYLRDEDTAKVFVFDQKHDDQSGRPWFRTGDIGKMVPIDVRGTSEDFLVITDRLKELIKVKGFQVAPAELEAHILALPFIADAVVVGIPDEIHGEVPAALVVVKPNLADPDLLAPGAVERTVEASVSAHFAHYKRLLGGVYRVEQVPKSLTGKLLRRVAKQTAAALAGAGNQQK